MTNIPIITLKSGKERTLTNFHPWIFSGAISKLPKDLVLGGEVIVADHSGKAHARGHYCGSEGLVVRLFCFDMSAEINEGFWLNKLEQAWRLRAMLALPSHETNGFRFLHGEGDGFSGLVCDIFGDSAVIQLSNPGLEPILPLIEKFLAERGISNTDSVCISSFRENNLIFNADLISGQKTGHFLDQRDNRKLLGQLVKHKRVLDAFCYSGGFSVYALKGGAQAVTSVDISEQAISLCKNHIEHNRPFVGEHHTIVADCFNYLREIKAGDFDVIVLDPPAFAKSSHAVERAARGYKDINLLALKNLAPGGLLFSFSCSQHVSVDLFRKIIFAAAKDAGRNAKVIYELNQAPDHPVSLFCPQSGYLKGLVCQVD